MTVHDIVGLVAGNDWQETIDVPGIPGGATVTNAWMLVKRYPGVDDVDAVIAKAITTDNVVGIGQITADGSTGTATLRFDLSKTDTALLGDEHAYHWAAKLELSTGYYYTPIEGKLVAKRQTISTTS